MYCIFCTQQNVLSVFSRRHRLFSGSIPYIQARDILFVLTKTWCKSKIVAEHHIFRLSVLMYKGEDSSFISAFVEAVGCTLLCGLVVTAAVLVTLGFMTWCQNIIERFPRYVLYRILNSLQSFYEKFSMSIVCHCISSCEDAAGQDIDKKDNISTNGFYIEIGTVQVSIFLI